ncbi:MAG: ferrous iron transport protein A [Sphaerochaetaceae bacterium]
MRTLDCVKPGEQVKIVKLNGEGLLRRRIMEMGITKNIMVKVIKVAPLGDPMQLNVRGYELSLRKFESSLIEVE